MARKTENLIRLPQEVRDKLHLIAKSNGLSLSVMVEKLIIDYKLENLGE
jgi:predicted DNA-binding protein